MPFTFVRQHFLGPCVSQAIFPCCSSANYASNSTDNVPASRPVMELWEFSTSLPGSRPWCPCVKGGQHLSRLLHGLKGTCRCGSQEDKINLSSCYFYARHLKPGDVSFLLTSSHNHLPGFHRKARMWRKPGS